MEDIKKLKETDGQDHILLHVVFDDKFPYSPPFIRVVKPVLSGGYVLAGGAICMELLTPQVIGQTATAADWILGCVSGLEQCIHTGGSGDADQRHPGEGKGKDSLHPDQGKTFSLSLSPLSVCNSSSAQGESYTLSKAQHAYKSLVKIHEKSGE